MARAIDMGRSVCGAKVGAMILALGTLAVGAIAQTTAPGNMAPIPTPIAPVETPASPPRTEALAAGTGSAALPEAYKPMQEYPRFNSNEPPFIANPEDLSRLKVQAPQWIRQFVAFPAPAELSRHVGAPTAEVRRQAAASITQVVNPANLPEGFEARLIPLSRWAVLYDDWRTHGGVDVFLTKFVSNRYVIGLCEAHNHVIVLVRDLSGVRGDNFEAIQRRAAQFADELLTEHLKPVSADSLKRFRTSMSPMYVYGYYSPKIEMLTGGGGESQDLVTTGGLPNETSSSSRATAVRFLCTGDFAAFLILKPAFGAPLKNPFDPRFEPMWIVRADEVPFWDPNAPQKQATPGTEEIKRRQMEEYLGRHFYDAAGQKIVLQAGYDELEKAFLELNPDQKVSITEQRMMDEYYLAGLRAFNGRDYMSALDYWSRLCDLDANNARVAVLLRVAIARRSESDLGNDAAKVKNDRYIGRAMDALARQQAVLADRRDAREKNAVRERAIADFRTRALDLISEGNYKDSLKEWRKLLEVDPGNPTALLYEDILMRRARGEVRKK
ncbi:MAG: hypothetical protein N2111_07770 [Candidatus Sumerlaeaceae bacterium]|nr:hypothetical protein [Candidatus Sumerlaeaceae bacterium]